MFSAFRLSFAFTMLAMCWMALPTWTGCPLAVLVNENCPLVFIEPHWDYVDGANPGDVKCIISPDGKHIYVERHANYRLLVYERDSDSGQVFLTQEIACDVPAGMLIAPDGKHVYVSCGGVMGGRVKKWVQGYRRDKTTGKIEPLPGAGLDDLRGARGILDMAASRDGRTVYALGDCSLFVLSRDPESGKLDIAHVFQDDNAADLIDGTTIPNAPTIAGAEIADGLYSAMNIAITPDDASVYTAGYGDNGVGVFHRDPQTGALAFVEAIKEFPNTNRYGLSMPRDVDVSPDGLHVYVAATGGYLAGFRRDPATGKLTWIERFMDERNGVRGLDQANSVVVSPSGKDVFVSSSGKGGAIARFARDPASGRLTFAGAVMDGECDCVTLKRSFWNAISPDGRHLYNCSQEHSVGVFAIPELNDANK
jgi:6-phosphogluconolactonase (cycloisomerase 2 family)